MRNGHIAAVEAVPGLNDEEAVKKSREMFEARKDEAHYEGFEVWELARMIIQYPPATEGAVTPDPSAGRNS
jgi:hypothetical protein